MRKVLSVNDVEFDPLSMVDTFGRVFSKDGRIFRGIYSEGIGICQDLFKSGLIDELDQKGLIPKTTFAELEVEGFVCVLEHHKITCTYPSEWTFNMFKDAVIAILEVNEICNKYGFQLKDGHPWNVTLDCNRPVFIDFGSITYRSSEVEANFWKEFKITCLYPLILWSMNEDYFAQKLLENGRNIYKRTIPAYELDQSNFIQNTVKDFYIRTFDKYKKSFSHSKLLKCLLPYKKQKYFERLVTSRLYDKNFIIENLTPPDSINTIWGEYQNDFFDAIVCKNIHERFARFNKIKSLINEFCTESETLLDLAGNMGGIGFYIEQDNKFKKIINVDYDENAIEASYKKLRQLNSNVETYILNFMLPKNMEISKKLKSDVVLALAITHHLLLSQGYNLDLIFNVIKSYSNKYVFIEFMPLGLWGGGDLPPIPDWYTVNWFRDNFVSKFELLYEDQLEKNRIIFVGKLR